MMISLELTPLYSAALRLTPHRKTLRPYRLLCSSIYVITTSPRKIKNWMGIKLNTLVFPKALKASGKLLMPL